MWQVERLKPSELIQNSSQEYRKESDALGMFISECCIDDPTAKEDQQRLYSHWRHWCQANGHHEGSKRTLTTRLEAKGINSKAYIGKVRAYQGICLNCGVDFA